MFKVSDLCTGKVTPVELVRETNCYYVVMFNGYEHRFHKATLFIEWQHLALRVK